MTTTQQPTDRHGRIAKVLEQRQQGLITDLDLFLTLADIFVTTRCDCVGCLPG